MLNCSNEKARESLDVRDSNSVHSKKTFKPAGEPDVAPKISKSFIVLTVQRADLRKDFDAVMIKGGDSDDLDEMVD